MIALKPISSQRQSVFRPAADRKGSILVIALWSLCLLVVFAINLGNGVRQKLILVYRLDEKSKLRFIAEAGIKKAIVELRKGKETIANTGEIYDSLNDNWSNNVSAFKDVDIGGGTFNISYTYIDGKSPYPTIRYGLIDEQRKININTADEKILRHLFRLVLDFTEVEAQELAASIVDWRDSDSELSIPLGSAEDYDYQGLRYPYEAKDTRFEVLEELLLVNGMDEEIFEKIKDYVTIYGDGKVNINTTSKVVLVALGLNEGLADKILYFRYGKDGTLSTPDDNVFVMSSTIVPELSQFCNLSDSEVAQLSVIVDKYLAVGSDTFKIRSVSKLDNGKNTAEITCMVNRRGKILYWQES